MQYHEGNWWNIKGSQNFSDTQYHRFILSGTMSTTLVDTLPQEVQNILHLNAKPASNHTPKTNGKNGSPQADYPYARLLPSYDHDFKLAPLEPFEHVDPGHAALKDANPQSFLEGAGVSNLTPRFGTEVSGLQLSSLGQKEKR